MAYIEFTKNYIRIFNASPEIKILNNGVFYFNRKCMEEYFSGGKYVSIWYDDENKKIGFKAEDGTQKGHYKMRITNYSGNICGIGFLKTFKIPYDKTKKYQAHWNSQDGIVEIQLDS